MLTKYILYDIISYIVNENFGGFTKVKMYKTLAEH